VIVKQIIIGFLTFSLVVPAGAVGESDVQVPNSIPEPQRIIPPIIPPLPPLPLAPIPVQPKLDPLPTIDPINPSISGAGGGIGDVLPFVAIPAVCLTGGELKVIDGTCDVIDAGEFGWELSDARSAREALRVLGKAAAGDIVIMSFPREMNLDRKVDLVRKMMNVEMQVFNRMMNRIEVAMNEDPVKARWLRMNAEIDSANVEVLRKSAAREFGSVAESVERHFTEHPHSSGVQGRCLMACRQAVAAAHGINVFDTH
jgi:hypothetical protein